MPIYATRENNSINAQNPDYTYPMNWFRVCCLIIPAKSTVLDFGPWTQVNGPCIGATLYVTVVTCHHHFLKWWWLSPPLFQSGICNFSSNSKFHTCNFTHNVATVSSRVIGLSRQAFPKQLTVHQLYYENTSFTYLLCHSHFLTLTSKLRNKVYTVDFGMAFCPVWYDMIFIHLLMAQTLSMKQSSDNIVK